MMWNVLKKMDDQEREKERVKETKQQTFCWERKMSESLGMIEKSKSGMCGVPAQYEKKRTARRRCELGLDFATFIAT